MSPPRFPPIPFFAGLPERQRNALSAAAREQHHGKDTVLFLKGDRPTGLHVVLAGTVKLSCQSSNGDEKIIDLPRRGQVFGEAAVLLDCPYPFAASALTAVRLLHVDARALRDLVGSSAEFARHMLLLVSRRICTIVSDLEDFRMRAPPERVARFLLEHGGAGERRPEAIRFPAPKHVLASRLGMVPESLSRAMRDLAEAGLVEVDRGYIRVLDWPRLAALVN
jgi:CRP-like cAMP-binding protein